MREAAISLLRAVLPVIEGAARAEQWEIARVLIEGAERIAKAVALIDAEYD